MASLVTSSDQIHALIGIGKKASEAAFKYQPIAERELRTKLTDATYDALETALPGNDVDAESAARAECLLALHHSIQVLGFRVVDNGGLAKHFGLGDYAGELLSPFQIGKLKQSIYAQAMELISKSLPGLDTIFENEADQKAQYQGIGFGFTAVMANDELS